MNDKVNQVVQITLKEYRTMRGLPDHYHPQIGEMFGIIDKDDGTIMYRILKSIDEPENSCTVEYQLETLCPEFLKGLG